MSKEKEKSKDFLLDNSLGESLLDKKNVGSFVSQIIFLTRRINRLTYHVQSNKKDLSSIRGLIALVNQRRSLIEYGKKIKQIHQLKDVLTVLHLESLAKNL